jgi:hypothetical protein
MRKTILAIALSVTAFNLSLGVVYAAVCESSKGAKACGTTCTGGADGSCSCTGSCTADERKWVDGTGGGDEELELLAQ